MGWHISNECPYCKKRITDEDEDVILIHKDCMGDY